MFLTEVWRFAMSCALPFTAVATAEKFALTSAAFAGVPGVNVLGTVTGPPVAIETIPIPIAAAAPKKSEVRTVLCLLKTSSRCPTALNPR
jgi:hypothetical protein